MGVSKEEKDQVLWVTQEIPEDAKEVQKFATQAHLLGPSNGKNQTMSERFKLMTSSIWKLNPSFVCECVVDRIVFQIYSVCFMIIALIIRPRYTNWFMI